MPKPPVLVVHLYEAKKLDAILRRLSAKKLPEGTQVYVGTYGWPPSLADARKITSHGFFFAPTFQLFPERNKKARKGRQVRKGLTLPPNDHFARPFPGSQKLPTEGQPCS